MGASLALTRDKEGIIDVWEMQDSPVFSLWEGDKKLLFSCTDEDVEERKATLIKYLDIIKNSGTANTFAIKFHEDPKNGRITNATPFYGSLPFTFREPSDLTVSRITGVIPQQAGNMDLLNQVFDARLQMLDMKYQHLLEEKDRQHQDELAALEAELEEKPAKEEDDGLGAIGLVGKAGERYPWMQDQIKDLITIGKSLINKFTNNIMDTTAPRQAAHAVAGAPEGATPNDKVSWAINTLVKYYTDKYQGQEAGHTNFANDMERLATMATTDADLFDLMIKKLRAAS